MKETARKNTKPLTPSIPWLGNYPGRALHRIGTALAGAWIVSTTLNIIWPVPDQVEIIGSSIERNIRNTPIPSEPISILLILTNNKSIENLNNKSGKNSIDKIDSLLLIKFEPKGIITVIQVPTDAEITLPEEEDFGLLSSAYNNGGVALTADLIKLAVDLSPKAPQRYAVTNIEVLREIVEGLGGIKVELKPELLKEAIKDQNSIEVSTVTKKIDGDFAKNLYILRDKLYSPITKLNRREAIIKGILIKITTSRGLGKLKLIQRKVSKKIKTNLTKNEFNSLLSIALNKNRSIVFRQIPLVKINITREKLKDINRFSEQRLSQ